MLGENSLIEGFVGVALLGRQSLVSNDRRAQKEGLFIIGPEIIVIPWRARYASPIPMTSQPL